MFGNEYTDFGIQMLREVPDYHKYSISQNLANVFDTLGDKIVSMGLDSSFKSTDDHSKMTESHVTNHSNYLSVNNDTVNSALVEFTEKTDIPIVIVIDDMEDVIGKTITGSDIIKAIKNREIEHLILPSVMLKKTGETYEEIFLDGLKIDDIKKQNKAIKIHILKDYYNFDEIKDIINSL
jgi:hypothetical protein